MESGLNYAIRHALNEHRRKLPLRSEAIDESRFSYLGLSADGANLEKLENSDWQVVYGRRGTGKTHLLRSFEELKASLATSIEHRVECCFYFSAQDFLISQEQMPEDKKALAYFQVFVEQFTRKILEYVDGLLESASTFDRLIGRSRAQKADVEELALRISEVSKYGHSLAGPAEFNRSRESSSASDNKSGGDIKLGFDSKTLRPTIGASLSLSSQNKSNNLDKDTFSAKIVSTPRFDQVKPLLLELLDALSIDRAFILIDEWPLLDPSGLQNIQPAFASLLKKTFAGTGRLSIKIATNRFQTQFAARDDLGTLVGLELDADIFEAVNLDHAMLAETELESFYATMIFKRLCYCSPQFAGMILPRPHGDLDESLQNIHEAPDGFIELIFKDRISFQELTRGCEGIPRDFLDLFNRASSKKEIRSINDRWNMGIIRDVISESRAASAQNDLEYNSPSYRLLNITIRKIVVESGRREFALHMDDHQNFSSLIDILLEKRIIHEYPPEKIPDELREYKLYLTDYGYCLDWARSYQQRHTTLSDDEFFFSTGGVTQDVIEYIRLDTDYLIRDKVVPDRKQCNHCKKGFSPEAPAYVKKGLCPNCFEIVK